MSDWHVHSSYIERRNVSRLSVTPLSFPSRRVARIGRISSPRLCPYFSCRLHIAPQAQYQFIDRRRGGESVPVLEWERHAWRDVTRRGVRNFPHPTMVALDQIVIIYEQIGIYLTVYEIKLNKRSHGKFLSKRQDLISIFKLSYYSIKI